MKSLPFLMIASMILVLGAGGARGQQAARPEILDAGYPRAFFFRMCERYTPQGMPYTRWERAFSTLDGIMGKALDEELENRSANIPAFTRFKKEHPEQAVILHFNGKARDPRFHGERFFAGHWLYFNGCRLTADLPAAAGESIVAVQRPNLFKAGTGRYQTSNEDLAICAIGPGGKPDWSRCEQVQLVSIDAAGKTLKVRRGAYGTKPLAFAKGRSYIAAHSSEGPWGKGEQLIWDYNFSSTCPRDARGQNCADVLVAEFKEMFAPGGALAAFDGVSFDVSMFDRSGSAGRGIRGIDANGDGQRDDGIIGGINVFGVGQYRFHEALRQALGEGRILQADGMAWKNQRSAGLLNGIESEGWPHLNDWEMVDWSGGLNRHFYWREAACPPVFNYINHKFVQKGGLEKKPLVPFNLHRMAFAAAMFTDASLCYSYAPEGNRGELAPVWDELIKGEEKQRHWLGKPLGEAVRLGQKAPDLLAGAGQRMDAAFATQWGAGAATVTPLPGSELKVEGRAGKGVQDLHATLPVIRHPGGDLAVYMTLRGEPRAGYPAAIPRLAQLGIGLDGNKKLSPLTPEKIGAWVCGKKMLAGFYFRDLEAGEVKLTLEVEGCEPVYVSGLTAHPSADPMARVIEHGMVLANPSTRPYSFNLAELAPGRAWRRLRGSPLQDPQTNNGQAVGEVLTLGPRDALLLAEK